MICWECFLIWLILAVLWWKWFWDRKVKRDRAAEADYDRREAEFHRIMWEEEGAKRADQRLQECQDEYEDLLRMQAIMKELEEK